MAFEVLRVSPLPREGAEKIHQWSPLVAEVPVYLRDELEDILLFRHMNVVEGKEIAERAARFSDWFERAIKMISPDGNPGKEVTLYKTPLQITSSDVYPS